MHTDEQLSTADSRTFKKWFHKGDYKLCMTQNICKGLILKGLFLCCVVINMFVAGHVYALDGGVHGGMECKKD